MKLFYNLLIAAIILAGCQQSARQDSFSMAATGTENEMMPVSRLEKGAAPDTPENPVAPQPTDKKKIIRDGRMGLNVKNLEQSRQKTDTLVAAFKGYYANENFFNTEIESSYNLKIRIPEQSFEKFMAAIEAGSDEITFKNVDARDVTAEFIDLETRLGNKKAYLKRYGELLQQARTVKDMLDIEEKIRVLEEEIESTEGRLKYLNDQVSYSTLDLTLTQKKDFVFKSGTRTAFFERLKLALSKGWYGFVDFVLFMFRLWPFLLIMAVIVPLFKKWRNKRRLSKTKTMI